MSDPQDHESVVLDALRASALTRDQISAGWVQTHVAAKYSIQEWLAAKGVALTKAKSASDHVLANAFKVGDAYVRKMRDDPFGNFDELKSNRFSQPTRNRRGKILDLDDNAKNLLHGDGPNQPKAPQQNLTWQQISDDPAQAPRTEMSNQDIAKTALANGQVDSDALARSVAAVIQPRLDAAKRELRSEILSESSRVEHSISGAIERRWTEALQTFEKKTQGLVDGLKDQIFKYIDESAPRKIEIVQSNRVVRTLPAEARHKAFDIGLKWLMIDQHLYIVGPAGTGKTHLFKQWGVALDKKVWLVGQALSKYDISGYKGPTGEYFGTVVRDALEQGGLLCIDEGDMWAAAALGFLNAPLANGWCAFPDKTIEVHPDFQCIIAANTFGRGATQEYIGRNPLDEASLDRFAYIIVDYDEDLERNIHGNGAWTQYVQRVRKAIMELKLRHIVSMRATQRLNAAIASGMDPEQALFSSVWRGLSPDTIAKIKSIAGQPPRSITIDIKEPAEDHPKAHLFRKIPENATLQQMRNIWNSDEEVTDAFGNIDDFIRAALDWKSAQDVRAN